MALRPELATAADRYDRLRAVVDALVGRGVVEPSLARTRWSWTAAGRRGRRPVAPAAVLYEWLLDRGPSQRKARPTPWPADGPAWLGADLASRVARTLGEGDWLAQE